MFIFSRKLWNVCVESEIGRKVDSASNFIVIPASLSHHIISKHVTMFLETLSSLFICHMICLFLFVNLTDFLSFLQIFFSGWILLRSTKEIKGFFFQVGMKFNWTGMSWTKTKCSFLSSSFALCLATPHEYSELHWVLVWFSISVFLSFSLSGHGPFFPTYTRTQEYRKTHT